MSLSFLFLCSRFISEEQWGWTGPVGAELSSWGDHLVLSAGTRLLRELHLFSEMSCDHVFSLLIHINEVGRSSGMWHKQVRCEFEEHWEETAVWNQSRFIMYRQIQTLSREQHLHTPKIYLLEPKCRWNSSNNNNNNPVDKSQGGSEYTQKPQLRPLCISGEICDPSCLTMKKQAGGVWVVGASLICSGGNETLCCRDPSGGKVEQISQQHMKTGIKYANVV